jgi:hypothetical protein
MAMPKASVDKYRLATALKDEVWRARQFPVMQPIPKAHAMDDSTDQHFGLRITSPNSRHALAALAFG